MEKKKNNKKDDDVLYTGKEIKVYQNKEDGFTEMMIAGRTIILFDKSDWNNLKKDFKNIFDGKRTPRGRANVV